MFLCIYSVFLPLAYPSSGRIRSWSPWFTPSSWNLTATNTELLRDWNYLIHQSSLWEWKGTRVHSMMQGHSNFIDLFGWLGERGQEINSNIQMFQSNPQGLRVPNPCPEAFCSLIMIFIFPRPQNLLSPHSPDMRTSYEKPYNYQHNRHCTPEPQDTLAHQCLPNIDCANGEANIGKYKSPPY